MDATPTEPRPRLMRRLLSSSIFHAVAAMAIVAAGWTIARNFDAWTGRARYHTTIDAMLAADVTPLSARVAGAIVAVEVADNQRVASGDVIARIDPAVYRAALVHAEGARDAAAASLDALTDREAAQHAIVEGAAAAIDAARAHAKVARAEARRLDTLAAGNLSVSEQQRETASAEADSADAAEREAEANLREQQAVEAGLATERRALRAARAQAAGGRQSRPDEPLLRYHRCPGGRNGRDAAGETGRFLSSLEPERTRQLAEAKVLPSNLLHLGWA